MLNKSVKNIVARVFSMLIAFFSTFIITRIVVSKSGDELYGFYSMSVDFVNYATVLSLALNSMAGRFITVKYYEGDLQGVNRLFNTIFYANMILILILMLPMIYVLINLDSIILINAVLVPEVRNLFLLMFANYLITIVASVFSVSTFLKNRVDLDSIRQSESNLIKVAIVYILYNLFSPNIIYLGIGTLIATIYIWILNIYYVRKLTPEIHIFQKSKIVWSDLGELLSSGIWNSISRVSAILLNGLDLFIANQFIGGTALGVLSIAKTLPKYFFSAIESFASVFTPGITIDYARGDNRMLVNRTILSIKICTLISNIISSLLISLGERVYELWVPGQQIISIQYITVIAIVGMIVVMPMEPLWAIFTATNKVKITSLYLFLESVITIGMVFFLLLVVQNEFVKLLIIVGVSSFFEILRGILFMPLFAANVLKVRWNTFYFPLVRAIVAFSITTIIGITISKVINRNGWIMLMLLIAIIGVICLIVNLAIVFSKDEVRMSIDNIRNLRWEKDG